MLKVKEVWKDVKGYEGQYQVSNLGQVRSVDRIVETVRLGKPWFRHIKERILKRKLNKHGYLVVGLSRNSRTKTFTVHRLVATAWCVNESSYDQVNHIDGDKLNNKAVNLEWCNQSMNTTHAFANNLISKRQKEISDVDIKIILEMYDKGLTAPEISKKFKYHAGTVSKVIKDNHIEYNTRQHVRNDLKLNWEMVDEIRELHKEGCTGRYLATLYNITPSNVSMIVNNKIWNKND